MENCLCIFEEASVADDSCAKPKYEKTSPQYCAIGLAVLTKQP